MHRGVDHDRVRVRLAEPVDGGLAAVVRAVVRDDEQAGRVLVLWPGHDLPEEVHERDDARGPGGGGEYFPGLDVQAGEQCERPVADILMLHAGRLAGSGGHGLVDAAAGLDGRLGVESNPGS